MPKKAEEFLLDTQLGEKKYEMKDAAAGLANGDAITLNIEKGAIPATLLHDLSRKKKMRSSGKGLFGRLDEKFQAIFGIKSKDLAIFFRLLAIMINAGIPLIRSLEVVGKQTKNSRLKTVIFEVQALIEKGGTFSNSMAQFPNIFDESYIGMIRSGEASGQLNNVLLDLANDVEKSAMVQRKVKGALMYPLFIFIILIGVIVSMMVFVVPKIADAFSDMGQDLPALTQALIDSSNWINQNLILTFAGFFAFILGIVFGKRTYYGKHFWDWFMIHLPIFGGLLRKTILARFARSFGNLLRSGIPIIEALRIVAKGAGNVVYRERINLAAEDLTRGIPLGESLLDSPLFPDMIVQMISIGEQTAQLDVISNKIASYYEEEVDTAVSSLTKVLEPLIIVVVGGVVGSLVGAIMLPLVRFSELAGEL